MATNQNDQKTGKVNQPTGNQGNKEKNEPGRKPEGEGKRNEPGRQSGQTGGGQRGQTGGQTTGQSDNLRRNEQSGRTSEGTSRNEPSTGRTTSDKESWED